MECQCGVSMELVAIGRDDRGALAESGAGEGSDIEVYRCYERTCAISVSVIYLTAPTKDYAVHLMERQDIVDVLHRINTEVSRHIDWVNAVEEEEEGEEEDDEDDEDG